MATATLPVTFALRMEDATKLYGSGDAAVRALDDVTIEIANARFTAIMGPSGSGKSTLLHCMAGLDALTSGRVVFGDRDLSEFDDDELTVLRRDRIGFVFQTFNLVPMLSAADNIRLPFILAGRAVDPGWFERVTSTTGLTARLGHRPAELSGGEQQRVALARALITRPDVVFADEPTGNLDTRSSAEILDFLTRAVDEFDQTLVMVTHDPGAAARADNVVFLSDGRIVDRMDEPTVEHVVEHLTTLGG